MTEDRRRERLRFRSWHRGTREMDLLLGTFADAHLAALAPAQLDAYEALLEQVDPDLYNWITGAEPVPGAQKGEVMDLLLKHRYSSQN
jgi:antitoxin CptB